MVGGGVLGHTVFHSFNQPAFIRRLMSGDRRLAATSCFFTGTFVFIMSFLSARAAALRLCLSLKADFFHTQGSRMRQDG
jgi:hypothetical protein